jgi:hypothetical protein
LTLQRRCWAINRHRRFVRRAGQWVDRDSGEPRFSVADLPAKTVGPEEAIERTEDVLQARARLGGLKPAERRVLVLIAAGYTYREVGQVTGFSYTKPTGQPPRAAPACASWRRYEADPTHFELGATVRIPSPKAGVRLCEAGSVPETICGLAVWPKTGASSVVSGLVEAGSTPAASRELIRKPFLSLSSRTELQLP